MSAPIDELLAQAADLAYQWDTAHHRSNLSMRLARMAIRRRDWAQAGRWLQDADDALEEWDSIMAAIRDCSRRRRELVGPPVPSRVA
jgi:hypothetical protein